MDERNLRKGSLSLSTPTQVLYAYRTLHIRDGRIHFRFGQQTIPRGRLLGRQGDVGEGVPELKTSS